MLLRIVFTIMLVISLTVTFSCRQINQERAVEYYDKQVKNFPEENQ